MRKAKTYFIYDLGNGWWNLRKFPKEKLYQSEKPSLWFKRKGNKASQTFVEG